jgi:hypothetical protein
MREPTAGRRTIPPSGPETETLMENVRLFTKRHRPCGRLWIDASSASAREATRRITVACLCGDTLDEIVATPGTVGHHLGQILEELARFARAQVA